MTMTMAQVIADLRKNWNWRSEPNELFPQLTNVLSLNNFDGADSGPRKQMFSRSHLAQALGIAFPTPRRLMTGAEMEYGEATFRVEIEKNSDVLAAIPYYNTVKADEGAIRHNPETFVFIEDERGEVSYVTLKDFCSHHPYFGFNYKNSKVGENLRRGSINSNLFLGEGTILQDSPNVLEDGNYCYGREANMACMTDPAGSEDGIKISESFLEKLTYHSYERRRVTYGTSHFPINAHGDDSKYKIFPDIGDIIPDSGILMALRPYDSDTRAKTSGPRYLRDKVYDACFAPVEMSTRAMQLVSHLYDEIIFAPPGGEIIDIRIIHDNSQQVKTPAMVNVQSKRYDDSRREFYQSVYRFYSGLVARRKTELKISHKFALLVRDAIAMLQEEKSTAIVKTDNVQKTYKKSSLDDYTVEFVIRYTHKPGIGNKGTGCHGDKGVFCKWVPTEDMPIDAWGNRADIVVDPYSTVSRMNLGRFYEQYFNAARRDLTRELHDLLGIEYPGEDWKSITMAEKFRVQKMVRERSNPELERWISRYIRFTTILRPEQGAWLAEYEQDRTRFSNHIVTVLEVGIYIHFPSNNSPELPDQVDAIMAEFMPRMSPVTFRGNSGKIRTSKVPVLIGSVYFILLEKTGSDWTAVSSAKLQNNGVISQVTNADKYSTPVRNKSIRFLGETELRILISYIGAMNAAEIMDRNNNIRSHTFAVHNLLSSPKPTAIEVLVDRNEIQLGDPRPNVMIKHYGYCAGWELKYAPYQELQKPATLIQ